MKKNIFKMLILASTLNAQNLYEIRQNIFNTDDKELIQAAKALSLAPISRNKDEQAKLLEKYDPSVKDYPSSKECEELGKKLFFDPRLSRSGLISCNTCHNLALGGVDGISVATGHKWQPNPHHLNSPSVFNAALNPRQFWDGRAAHLKEQAAGPITSSVEMAQDKDELVQKINSIAEYKSAFTSAFNIPEADFEHIVAAIAIFERTLLTPSRFDDFLNGKINALSKQEKQGLRTFINKGCIICHNGINIGGEFRGFGFDRYQYSDLGDFRGNEYERVKVPSLRNVARTAPYFHNGEIWTLNEAVESMGRIQLGVELSEQEISDLIAFLKSLSGELPQIVYPQLPTSSDETIRPKLDL